MVGQLEDAILDGGLTLLDTAATHIVICQAEPTHMTLASVGAANCLGYKNFGGGSAFGSPASAAGNGRKVTSASLTDGTIVTNGTASWWAAINGTTALYARNTLSTPQVVTAGGSFSFSAVFDITIPAHV